jgi:hypothetical protein
MAETRIAPSLVAFALAGCAGAPSVQTTFDPPYPETNSVGDPIVSVFAGRVPCTFVDCEMMKVLLVFYGRAGSGTPTTYWLGYVGVGRGNDRTVWQGTWTLQRGADEYPQAQVYALDATADPGLRYFWRVNEDILLPLDPSLHPQVGTAAWGTMLSRDAEPYGPKTYCYDQRARRFVAPTRGGLDCPARATQ